MCEELEHKLVDAEINPLMVSEGKGGVKAADGLLVLKKNKAQNIVHFILLTP